VLPAAPALRSTSYFNENPGEEAHLDFLRWYTGAAGSKAHQQRIILQAAGAAALAAAAASCSCGTS
jgi:hypothetical protein